MGKRGLILAALVATLAAYPAMADQDVTTPAPAAAPAVTAAPAAAQSTDAALDAARMMNADMEKSLAEAKAQLQKDLAETQAKLSAAEDKLSATEAKLEAADRRMAEIEARMTAISGSLDRNTADVTSATAQLTALGGKARLTDETLAPLLAFKPYGYIKLDAIYDSTRTSSTDATAFVLQENPGVEGDKQFSMTARQTRLGVNIIGQDIGEAKSAGKIEIDFYNTASIENKATPMLRQAYWQLSYPNWNVLAGQAFEVVSPLFPNTINYAFMALQGNPGYRKPMVRYERTDPWGDRVWTTDVAIARSIGGTVLSTSSLDDAGSSSGLPVLQAREGITIPTRLKRPVVLGLSGHLGRTQVDTVTAGVITDGDSGVYSTYMGNLDYTVPLAAKWDVKGEFWQGKNLDGYFGGIGQGVNTATGTGIRAAGGWSQLTYKPVAKWCLSAGAGIDDPDNSDLGGGPTAPNRSQNTVYFTNAIYNLTEKVMIGAELSYMRTNYLVGPEGENVRFQSALQYSF